MLARNDIDGARNDRVGFLEVAGLEMPEGLEQGAEGFQEAGWVA